MIGTVEGAGVPCRVTEVCDRGRWAMNRAIATVEADLPASVSLIHFNKSVNLGRLSLRVSPRCVIEAGGR